MDLLTMIEIYTCIPGVVEFQEAKTTQEIDKEIEVRKFYIDLGVVSPWA